MALVTCLVGYLLFVAGCETAGCFIIGVAIGLHWQQVDNRARRFEHGRSDSSDQKRRSP